MGPYLTKRLLEMIAVALILSALIFLLMRALPGDPAQMMAGLDATPEMIAAIRTKLGLDLPLPAQYVLWFSGVLRGDLGRSYTANIPVAQLILERLPATLLLTITALLLALLLSFPLGIIQALREGSLSDSIISTFSSIGISLPTFWLGLLFILTFSIRLKWLPPSGYAEPFEEPIRFLRYLALPALTLAIPLMAMFVRFIRAALLEVIGKDYVRVARAKGLEEQRIALGHVVPNGLIPIIAVIGVQLSRLLGGAIIIEIIFAWPGIGRLLIQAINNRDYATVQGVLLVLGALYVFVSLLTDLVSAAADPRIRLEGKRR
jgi:peptide/nickel transport system permease protein